MHKRKKISKKRTLDRRPKKSNFKTTKRKKNHTGRKRKRVNKIYSRKQTSWEGFQGRRRRRIFKNMEEGRCEGRTLKGAVGGSWGFSGEGQWSGRDTTNTEEVVRKKRREGKANQYSNEPGESEKELTSVPLSNDRKAHVLLFKMERGGEGGNEIYGLLAGEGGGGKRGGGGKGVGCCKKKRCLKGGNRTRSLSSSRKREGCKKKLRRVRV